MSTMFPREALRSKPFLLITSSVALAMVLSLSLTFATKPMVALPLNFFLLIGLYFLLFPIRQKLLSEFAEDNNLIIKDKKVLDKLYAANYYIFNKSGVLTQGKWILTDVIPVSNFSSEKILGLTLALCQNSPYPFSQTLTDFAISQNAKSPQVESVVNIPGRGLKATLEHLRVALGSLALMADFKTNTDETKHKALPLFLAGKTVLFLSVGEEIKALFAFKDSLQEKAWETIAELNGQGFKTALITGDNETTARFLAAKINIGSVHAGLSPAQKAEKVNTLKQRGFNVALIADPAQDSESLALASLSIGIAATKGLTGESPDIVLRSGNLKDFLKLFNFSLLFKKTIDQNAIGLIIYFVSLVALLSGLEAKLNLQIVGSILAVLIAVLLIALNIMNLSKLEIDKSYAYPT